MNNFGVVELASAKTTLAPGWAYVPDTSVPSSAALQQQPGGRKRARNAPSGPSIGDLTARQEARIRKEVEALQLDGNKDNTIPIPVKPGRKAQGKTGTVRKILQSQKTFANHLDDFLAFQQAEASAAAASANSRRANTNKSATTPVTQDPEDTSMTDADAATAAANTSPPALFPPPYRSPPPSHPGDSDPLLMSRVPEPPTDREIRALLAHPPLTYLEARGTWEERGRPPARAFCEVCGYWGRVRCMKCGTRVCALDCLETHREECVTRYGL
ncbi:hypothetical protein ACRE_047300 [Hapsidospora chrysogenum ATCC 11550]|uniref:HIT-type domain-containing protein n=1 Tax=Hapsidospora chrysogenum (strain ATCC 11550 / CBS 779.69 / DSM 880 / IAM 14645 / JCM 23072 / IMI 49137) TaxID=857340 RepID=A0A086T551_HAPC1|nr:hypothetical protein ACRE_047300 [Hapsidospora chrysogenum ATCC 11550]